MLHSAARSPVPCCKISTATLPIFSWDHWVNNAYDLGAGLVRSQTQGMLFMNPAPFPLNGNSHTVFKHAFNRSEVLEARIVHVQPFCLGRCRSTLGWTVPQRGVEGSPNCPAQTC